LIPKRQMRNLRNAKARLARAGDTEICIADSESLGGMLSVLFELHEKRWLHHAGRRGVLQGSQIQAFHRKSTSLLLNEGVLRLYGLRVKGQTISSLYAFTEKDVVYCYLQGFDPEFNFFSPGTVILSRVIQDAITAKVRRIDFLRGQEDYKYRWGARDIRTYRRTLQRSNVHKISTERQTRNELLNEIYSNP